MAPYSIFLSGALKYMLSYTSKKYAKHKHIIRIFLKSIVEILLINIFLVGLLSNILNTSILLVTF